jgi:hypothetical protein
MAKVHFARELTISVHNAMCRYRWLNMVTGIHCPSDHASTAPTTQKAGNGSITGYPAWWNQPHHIIYPAEKIFIFRAGREYFPRFFYDLSRLQKKVFSKKWEMETEAAAMIPAVASIFWVPLHSCIRKDNGGNHDRNNILF